MARFDDVMKAIRALPGGVEAMRAEIDRAQRDAAHPEAQGLPLPGETNAAAYDRLAPLTMAAHAAYSAGIGRWFDADDAGAGNDAAALEALEQARTRAWAASSAAWARLTDAERAARR